MGPCASASASSSTLDVCADAPRDLITGRAGEGMAALECGGECARSGVSAARTSMGRRRSGGRQGRDEGARERARRRRGWLVVRPQTGRVDQPVLRERLSARLASVQFVRRHGVGHDGAHVRGRATHTRGGFSCRCESTTSFQTSRPNPRKARSTFTSGLAMAGRSCSRTRRTSRRCARPSSATWRASSRSSTSGTARSSASAWTASATTRSGRRTF